MPKPKPWSCIPIEKWQELLALVVVDRFADEEVADYDHEWAAMEAGLDEEQTAALKAWVRALEIDEEARRLTGELSQATKNFIADLEKSPPARNPEETEAVEKVMRNLFPGWKPKGE